MVGILTLDRYRVRPEWRNEGPLMSEASPRRPVCGGAFSLPVHKKRPQNFDGEGGGAMFLNIKGLRQIHQTSLHATGPL